MANLPALPVSIFEMEEEYNSKVARIADTIQALKDAEVAAEEASCVQGTFVENVIQSRYVSDDAIRRNLRRSAWKCAYTRLQIDRIATAKDKALFERQLQDPPEFTAANVKATFADYLINPRHHVLRGLAEVFSDLDPAFKSHDRVKIGVAKLPKRVIITGFNSIYGHGRDKLRDVLNSLCALRRLPLVEYAFLAEIERQIKLGDYRIDDVGLELRLFGNGNLHIFFDKWALVDVNRALAEFYGEVLPDAYDKPGRPSTAVAKDLQFYWTPGDVADRLTEYGGVRPDDVILEPSCGEGHLLRKLRELGVRKVHGIEIEPGRARKAAEIGYPVQWANFLEVPPDPNALFDKVVMNPPFYGKHYAKHIRHALKFLREGGVLVAVVPYSAKIDHGLLDEFKPDWFDLPIASFSEAGTNVATTIARIRKKGN